MTTNIDDVITRDKKDKHTLRLKIVVPVVAVIVLAVLIFIVVTTVAKAPQRATSLTENAQVKETATVTAPDSLTDESSRKALQQALSDSSSRLGAVAENAELVAWSGNAVTKLKQQLQQAYSLYGEQKYADVPPLLDNLNQQLQQLQSDFVQTYENTYRQALAAFEQQQLNNARLLVSQTLAVKADFAPAIQLQQRLAVAGQVQALWEEVQIATLENNTAKQQSALQQIIQLDAAQQDAVTRLAQLQQGDKAQRFAAVMAEAVAAFDNGQYEQARQALPRAAAIDNKRPELATLRAQLDTAQKTQSVAQAEQQIAIFSGADEWQTVKMVAENTLKAHPDNQVARQALLQANQILQAEQRLEGYIAAPQRLADDNIRQRAAEAIAQAQTLSGSSHRLSLKITQLQGLMTTQNQQVQVIVKSDNRTLIKVLGVGVVGEVTEKSITLAPGTYRFEGSRQGYRSEIMTVVLDGSESPVVVQLQCQTRV